MMSLCCNKWCRRWPPAGRGMKSGAHSFDPMLASIDVSETTSAEAGSSIYRYPGFLPFLIGRLASVSALQIQAVVVAWQVYDATRDPLSLAYVGLAQFIPMLLLLLPAGDLIDRFDRKRILAVSWAVEALCGALLLWLSLGDVLNTTAIYVVLALFGCARAFTGPTLQSLLPQVVPRERLAAAIAANSMIMRGANIAGPLLGGGLYALGDAPLSYALCMAGFLLGLAIIGFEIRVKEVSLKRLIGAAIGSILGLLGAIGYGWVMVLGLRTWWIGAVGTRHLTLHISWPGLMIGIVAGTLFSVLAMLWTLRALRRNSPRMLLSGALESNVVKAKRGKKLIASASLFLLLALLLLVLSYAGKMPQLEGFFGSAFLLLIAILCATAVLLHRKEPHRIRGHGWRALCRLGY